MRNSTAALLAISLLGACATDEDNAPGDQLTEAQFDIFGQVSGAHQVNKIVAWDAVVASPGSTPALTSWTVQQAFYQQTTLRGFYRDHTSSACLHSVYSVDGGWWYYDTSLTSCGDQNFDGDVAAIQWGASRYDLFWFQTALFGPTHLKHLLYDGAWHAEDLGAVATNAGLQAPAVASWNTNRIDVLWHDSANDIRMKTFDRSKKGLAGFDAGGWSLSDVAVVHQVPAVAISVAEPAVGEIDIAWRQSNATMAVATSTNSGASFTSLGIPGAIDGPPALVSWGGGSLMAVNQRAASTGTSFRQYLRTGPTTWHDAGFDSDHAFTSVIGAASSSRANRADFLALSGGNVIHSFYQESLPGFLELNNPDTDNWCYANTDGMVVNYLNLHTSGWVPESTCQMVSMYQGKNCCGSPMSDTDCHQGGNTLDLLDQFGVDVQGTGNISFDSVRLYTQILHQPVIVHEAHNNDSGSHVVVLRDAYRVNNTNYVELTDPANGGLTWVWDWDSLVNYNTNWHMDAMYHGITLQ